jgi:hypothetical protein
MDNTALMTLDPPGKPAAIWPLNALTSNTLTGRDRALLGAVAAGRCDVRRAGSLELRVDGRWFSDQIRVQTLAQEGLLGPAVDHPGARVQATLLEAGRAALRTR